MNASALAAAYPSFLAPSNTLNGTYWPNQAAIAAQTTVHASAFNCSRVNVTSNITAVSGTPASWVRFDVAATSPGTAYTICSTTRYSGTTRQGGIIVSDTQDDSGEPIIIHGHWRGVAGAAKYGVWIRHLPLVNSTDWLSLCASVQPSVIAQAGSSANQTLTPHVQLAANGVLLNVTANSSRLDSIAYIGNAGFFRVNAQLGAKNQSDFQISNFVIFYYAFTPQMLQDFTANSSTYMGQHGAASWLKASQIRPESPPPPPPPPPPSPSPPPSPAPPLPPPLGHDAIDWGGAFPFNDDYDNLKHGIMTSSDEQWLERLRNPGLWFDMTGVSLHAGGYVAAWSSNTVNKNQLGESGPTRSGAIFSFASGGSPYLPGLQLGFDPTVNSSFLAGGPQISVDLGYLRRNFQPGKHCEGDAKLPCLTDEFSACTVSRYNDLDTSWTQAFNCPSVPDPTVPRPDCAFKDAYPTDPAYHGTGLLFGSSDGNWVHGHLSPGSPGWTVYGGATLTDQNGCGDLRASTDWFFHCSSVKPADEGAASLWDGGYVDNVVVGNAIGPGSARVVTVVSNNFTRMKDAVYTGGAENYVQTPTTIQINPWPATSWVCGYGTDLIDPNNPLSGKTPIYCHNASRAWAVMEVLAWPKYINDFSGIMKYFQVKYGAHIFDKQCTAAPLPPGSPFPPLLLATRSAAIPQPPPLSPTCPASTCAAQRNQTTCAAHRSDGCIWTNSTAAPSPPSTNNAVAIAVGATVAGVVVLGSAAGIGLWMYRQNVKAKAAALPKSGGYRRLAL
jgi:hypothetical protein